jgi:hypothetical protein
MCGWFNADAARFALKALKCLVIPRQFVGQKFQGDETAELGVLAFVDRTRTAAAQPV